MTLCTVPVVALKRLVVGQVAVGVAPVVPPLVVVELPLEPQAAIKTVSSDKHATPISKLLFDLSKCMGNIPPLATAYRILSIVLLRVYQNTDKFPVKS